MVKGMVVRARRRPGEASWNQRRERRTRHAEEMKFLHGELSAEPSWEAVGTVETGGFPAPGHGATGEEETRIPSHSGAFRPSHRFTEQH